MQKNTTSFLADSYPIEDPATFVTHLHRWQLFSLLVAIKTSVRLRVKLPRCFVSDCSSRRSYFDRGQIIYLRGNNQNCINDISIEDS